MSLETPIKIRMLQTKLYQKAKEEPNYRFYLLYDKMWREDILLHAYELAKAHKGAPGVDGQSFEHIESEGRQEWLAGIRKDLRDKTYEPRAVRRVMIPKPGGGERPLGIPTIRDRVVQTAAKLLLEPIFEADFDPHAYGYRPKRSAQDAIQEVHELLCSGYTDVVDADLSQYFDTIPHCELMQCVARRIVDRDMLRLIKMWLKVPVEERDENGNRKVSGGQQSTCGTPQGGVISPLLANLYMNRFLKYWRITGAFVNSIWPTLIVSFGPPTRPIAPVAVLGDPGRSGALRRAFCGALRAERRPGLPRTCDQFTVRGPYQARHSTHCQSLTSPPSNATQRGSRPLSLLQSSPAASVECCLRPPRDSGRRSAWRRAWPKRFARTRGR